MQGWRMVETSLIIKRPAAAASEIFLRTEPKIVTPEISEIITPTVTPPNHKMLELVPAALYICDASGVVTFYNKAAAQLWGRSPEFGTELWCGSWKIFEVGGKTLPIENFPMAITIREKKAVRDKEIIIAREDGTKSHVIPHCEPLFDEAGNFAGAINTLVDITEKYKVQREKDEQFRVLANSMPQLVWISDSNGYANWYNQSWYDYTGTDGEDAREKICHPEHIERVTEHFTNCFEKGEIWEDTFPLLGKDGQYRWFLSRAYPLRNEEGKITHWFGTNTDISERLATKESNNQNDNLQELLTPMNGIIGMSHILAKTAPLTLKQKEYISNLQLSSGNLLATINKLLGIEEMKEENIAAENCSFSLRELIEQVMAAEQKAASTKNLILELDYDQRLKSKYIGNAHELKKVLMNLLGNAVKFTEQGSVKIIVGLVSEAQNIANIVMHVVDTGVGIHNSKLKKLFETSSSLAQSREQAVAMGGDISVESRENMGSEFTLHVALVLDSVKSEKKNSSSKLANTADAATILIVEGYKPNLQVAASYLEMLGYKYETAQNAKEAVEKVQSGSFDAVLMDAQMPDMDGFTTTKAIRKWENAKKIKPTPIIATTTYSSADEKEKCLEAGMNDYLAKPFTTEILQQKLENILNNAANFYQSKAKKSRAVEAG